MKTICKIIGCFVLGVVLLTLAIIAGLGYFEFLHWFLPKIGVV